MEPAQKRTRIQAPELRPVKFSQLESQSNYGPGGILAPDSNQQANLSSSDISSASLAELCHSHYLMGKGKAGKKLIGPNSEGGNRKATKATTAVKQQSEFNLASSSFSQTSSQPSKSGLRVEMIDGKIVIKESSLIVNEAAINETEYEEVEEGALVTSRYSSFTNRKAAKVWGIEETRLFYSALRQCGLEFSLMQSFFPNRTRKEIKLKFRREERQHPELIKKALETTLPLELTPFELQLGEEIVLVTQPEVADTIDNNVMVDVEED